MKKFVVAIIGAVLLLTGQPTVAEAKAEALREAAENVPAYVKPRLLALADRLAGGGSDA